MNKALLVRRFKKNWVWLAGPILLLALALGLHLARGGGTHIGTLEVPLHDAITSLQLNTQSLPDTRIVVVDIDEPSLDALGRWPWGRERVAQLFQVLLNHYQVSLVGSDILFVDDTPSANLKPLQAVLSDPRVLNAMVWSPYSSERKGTFTAGAQPLQMPPAAQAQTPQAQGWLAPNFLPPQAQRAHISPRVSADGVVRQLAPVVCVLQSQCVESLPLGLYRMLLAEQPVYTLRNGTWYLGTST